MAEKKYSYIKYPYSKNGWISFGLAAFSLLATVTVVLLSIFRNGGTTLFLAALGFTAFVMSFMGMWFCYLSLTEKEKNYFFGLLGGGLSLAVTLAWVFIIAKGN